MTFGIIVNKMRNDTRLKVFYSSYAHRNKYYLVTSMKESFKVL